MCWSCSWQEGWLREGISWGCSSVAPEAKQEPWNLWVWRLRGAAHHLQARPEPYVHSQPDSWFVLWVQVYYCSSNSLFLLKCLHLQYVQALLCLRCLDNWPDHQSKAPSSSALEKVGMTCVHPNSCPGAAPAPSGWFRSSKREGARAEISAACSPSKAHWHLGHL